MGFVVWPCTHGSRSVLERAEHVLIGLSPWNSYYKPRVVEALVGWASANFARVDVFVPGDEAAHTLAAAGAQPTEAVRRARYAIGRLRAPARRGLKRAGVPDPDLHLHSWTQLSERPPYQRCLKRVRDAYHTDEAIRGACRRTARAAVRHLAGREPTEEQVDQAVGYAIAELPLILDGPNIFGTKSSLFVYHREMDLLSPFISGSSSALRPAPGQGYAVVRSPEADSTHPGPHGAGAE
ncbi:tRNA-dependent cyclodipeptide synthase (plasmid) [Embleya sp. NBC_00888]|uniref:tRNA-dependent cyclodipeptide synthase n=1 Tax=Embleya sp. NBC_00888 TaxID=2975960 RepID=UPI002F91A0E2|nr:tRNA-dependent cyclodipeptide synthase [Embleya sp. NBC_00888]